MFATELSADESDFPKNCSWGDVSFTEPGDRSHEGMQNSSDATATVPTGKPATARPQQIAAAFEQQQPPEGTRRPQGGLRPLQDQHR